MMDSVQAIIATVKSMYGENGFIPLHEPRFIGNEKKYLNDCIDSTFVSSVGEYVNRFERDMCTYTGAKYAIAVVNGTAGLHLSLVVAGVKENDIVITQAVSFAATANAISYTKATPLFVDIDLKTIGMSYESLKEVFNQVEMVNGEAIYQPTRQRIGAVVPMHTFGFPVEIDRIVELCSQYNVPVIEDAAESIGSTYKGKHTGTFGLMGVYSFNGNKTITCGGGGIIVTNDETVAKMAKHLSTQAKTPHKWEFNHDHLGYNYRCPNLNAALACAQLEQIENFIENKRQTAKEYEEFFKNLDVQFVKEPEDSRSNYWLNALIFRSEEERNHFLEVTNDNNVMTRPIWTLLNRLPYIDGAITKNLENSIFIEKCLANIPSSVRI